jgi:WD40 repeat protein/nucleoside phosphorylase
MLDISTHAETHLENALIITTDQIEAFALFTVFSKHPEQSRRVVNGSTYYQLGLDDEAQIFLLRADLGNAQAGGLHLSIQKSFQDLTPQLVIICGTAYGLHPDQQKLGDVIIAEQIEWYPPQGDNFQGDLASYSESILCSERTLTRVQNNMGKKDGFSLHVGQFLSSESLVKDSSILSRLLKHKPDAIGGDTVGGDVYASVKPIAQNCVLIKGIWKWLVGNTDAYYSQLQAATNAAKYVWSIFQSNESKQKKRLPRGQSEKSRIIDQSGQIINGPQTNITGEVQGTVLSGTFGTVKIKNVFVRKGNQPSPQARIFTAPPLPPHFVQRPHEIEALATLLLNEKAGTPVAITTALQGGGGFGKTTLATALCHDLRVQEKFTDGILWITLGENPNVLGLLNDQIKLLDRECPISNDINTAGGYFRDLVGKRNLLIVLDDVWDVWHARQFIEGNLNCAKAITTRRQDVAAQLRTHSPINVCEMRTAEAMQLLVNWLDTVPISQEPFMQFAQELGEWPLLLELAGAQLRELVTLDLQTPEEALETLRGLLVAHGFTAFDRADESQRNSAIRISLEVSLKRLGKDRDRFYELAVFAEDADIPVDAIVRLWEQTANLSDVDSQNVFRAIQRLSLFSTYLPEQKTVRLHDVIHAFIGEQQHDKLVWLHQKLLDAFRSVRHPNAHTFWGELPGKEIYLWDNLAYHLVQAELIGELVTTVKDLTYLAIKIQTRGVFSAEADLKLAEKIVPEDAELCLLRHAFANMTHLLTRCTSYSETSSILFSRLRHLPAFAGACADFETFILKPYITQYHSLPDLPDPFLERTLPGAISLCAISPDSQWIVFLSRDGTNLLVHDLSTGIHKLTINHNHDTAVKVLAVSQNSSFILSASHNGSLKVWDAVTGLEKMNLNISGFRPMLCATSMNEQFIFAIVDYKLRVWDATTGERKSVLAGNFSGRSVSINFPHDPRIEKAFAAGSEIIDDFKEAYYLTADGCWIFVTKYKLKTTVLGFSSYGFPRMKEEVEEDAWGEIIESNGWSQRFLLKIPAKKFICMRSHNYPDDHQGIISNAQWLIVPSSSLQNGSDIWEIESETKIHTLPGKSMGVSSDSQKIITNELGAIKIWNTLSWTEDLTLMNCGKLLTMTPAGDKIVSYDQTTRSIRLLDIDFGKSRHHCYIVEQNAARESSKSFLACAISPDGKWVVACGRNSLSILNSETGFKLRETELDQLGCIQNCIISSDGRKIIVAFDRETKIWNVSDILEDLSIIGCYRETEQRACVISRDGLSLVSVGRGFIHIYDSANRSTRVDLKRSDAYYFHDCAVSPNGYWVVVVGGPIHKEGLRILDVDTGERKFLIPLHNRSYVIFANKCKISPNGQWVVVAFADGTLKMWRIWDIENPEEMFTLRGHTGQVANCAVSLDGQRIVSVTDTGECKVWVAKSGQCIATFRVDDSLNDCVFHPDGKRIIAVGDRGIYWLKLVE